MKNITAVIPIRKGSQRVIDKNVRPFGDTTLLEFKINTLKKVKGIGRIVVNTDSEVAVELAKKNGVDFHIREAYYASSECPANDYFEYLGKTTEAEYIAYTPVTAPFISVDTFEKCIREFDYTNPDDTIITGKVIKDFLFQGNTPLNFELKTHPRSQDFQGFYAINFGICLLSRKKLLETRTILGSHPRVVEVDEIEGIDIDTQLDFEFAELVYRTVIMQSGIDAGMGAK